MASFSFLASIGDFWRWIRSMAVAHKFWATVVIVLVLYGGYRVYASMTAPSTATRYVTTTVATGTVVSTLTETGQVDASQQLSLSPKASGEVVGVYVEPGQQVAAGQIIAQLDATDAVTALQNAKLSLQHEELSYQQTTATSTLALNLLQAQNGVTTAQTSLQKTHDSSYASIAQIYTDLSNTISDLDSALHDSNVSGHSNQQNIAAYSDAVSSHDDSIDVYSNSAESSYDAAVTAYQTALAQYKTTSLTSTDDDITTLADETYTASQAVAEAVKDAHDFFDRVNTDYTLYNLQSSSALTTLLNTTNTDTTTVNNDLSNSLTAKSDIVSAEQALAVAQNTLEATEGGSNTLTVQSAELSLQQAQQAVTTAQENVDDYSVYAPFAGTIASVGVKKYDQAGSGTAVATLVTSTQEIDLTVNEVDASKIHVGQKAMVTFDALSGVTIAGTVATIDTVGTVSQGVVSYDVVVGLDTQNANVKPGMSATADIITGTESGLVVPSAAIKTTGGLSYVQVFNPALAGSSGPQGATSDTPPTQVPVTVGLTGDTTAIIETGLTAGEQVVTQTVAGTSAASKSSATQSTSIFGGAGATRAVRTGGGGAVFRAGGG